MIAPKIDWLCTKTIGFLAVGAVLGDDFRTLSCLPTKIEQKGALLPSFYFLMTCTLIKCGHVPNIGNWEPRALASLQAT